MVAPVDHAGDAAVARTWTSLQHTGALPSCPLRLSSSLQLYFFSKKKKSKIGFKLISSHHFSDCILGQFPSQYLQQSTVFCVCGFLKLSLNISSIPV